MVQYDPQDTLNKIVKIVSEVINTPVSSIHGDSTFESLGADSLDMLQMIMKFEDTFGIEISDDEAARIKTVGEAAQMINKARTK